jgi:hypothetical protein
VYPELGWLHSQEQLDNYSTTRSPTTELKDCINPRDKPTRKHAAGCPSLYIPSPHNLPSSRTPLVTPHRAPTRHQPRFSTVNTHHSLHSMSATPSRRQAEARACEKLYQEYHIEASRTAIASVCPGCFAPALPDAEVPVADGGLWGAGAQGWARSGAGTDAVISSSSQASAKLGTRRRFKDLGYPDIWPEYCRRGRMAGWMTYSG